MGTCQHGEVKSELRWWCPLLAAHSMHAVETAGSALIDRCPSPCKELHCTLKGECSHEATPTANTDTCCAGKAKAHKLMEQPQREIEHGLWEYNRGPLPAKTSMHACVCMHYAHSAYRGICSD